MKMKAESGVRRAVASSHVNLPLTSMRRDIMPDRPATWLLKKKGNQLKLPKQAGRGGDTGQEW
jgi:hypothetical protein